MCGSNSTQAWILEYYILELDFGEDYLEGAPRKTRVKVGKLDQLKWANAFGGGRAAPTGQKCTVYCCITNAGALLLCIALSPTGRRNWRRAREWLARRGSAGHCLQPLSPLFHRLRSLTYKYRLQKAQCQSESQKVKTFQIARFLSQNFPDKARKSRQFSNSRQMPVKGVLARS